MPPPTGGISVVRGPPRTGAGRVAGMGPGRVAGTAAGTRPAPVPDPGRAGGIGCGAGRSSGDVYSGTDAAGPGTAGAPPRGLAPGAWAPRWPNPMIIAASTPNPRLPRRPVGTRRPSLRWTQPGFMATSSPRALRLPCLVVPSPWPVLAILLSALVVSVVRAGTLHVFCFPRNPRKKLKCRNRPPPHFAVFPAISLWTAPLSANLGEPGNPTTAP